MSNIVTNLCRRLKLPPTHKAVLMCLADYSHDNGRDWHSLAALCEWTCLARSTVIDALQSLEAAGVIAIKRTGRNNVTQINLERLEPESEVQDADLRGPGSGPQKSRSRTSDTGHEVQEADLRGPGGDTEVQEADLRGPAGGPDTSITSTTHQTQQQGEGQRRKGKTAKHSLPDGFDVSSQVEAWAIKNGHARLPERLEDFVLKAQAGGYEYADWDAAFKKAIRDDWAGLNDLVSTKDVLPGWRVAELEKNRTAMGPAFSTESAELLRRHHAASGDSRKPGARQQTKHIGFDAQDYSEGVRNGRIV